MLIFGIVAGAWDCGQPRRRTTEFSMPPGRGGAGAQARRAAGRTTVDGVAARIEDDIITESEIRELGAFQSWWMESETARGIDPRTARPMAGPYGGSAAKYAQPPAADVDRAYAEFVKQFPSPEEFQKRAPARD